MKSERIWAEEVLCGYGRSLRRRYEITTLYLQSGVKSNLQIDGKLSDTELSDMAKEVTEE